MPQHKPFVLFVCRHNTGRSQMAEAYLRRLAGNVVQVASAGTTPDEQIDPVVVSAMAEVGIDISAARPKLIEQGMVDDANLVITMCCDVHGIKRSDQEWNLPDPKGQSLHQVRKIRNMVKKNVRSLIPLLEQETK